ncbi:MAG: DNA-binding response regulator [Chloroflexi bacterium]|nr:MAG: DNA-binding response regulator [Chloroflexota bacterium]
MSEDSSQTRRDDETARLRVLVIAADPLVRAALATLLHQSGYTLAGQASPGADLAAEVTVYRPEAVLWDLGWDPEAGLEDTLDQVAALAGAGLAVVALLAGDEQAGAVRAAGAKGLLPRDAAPGALAAALEGAGQGLLVLDPGLAARAMPSPGQGAPGLPQELTARESEVLQLLAAGLTNRAIAMELGISEHTVKFHVNAILGKLGAQSRTEAVVQAFRDGLLLL